MKTADARKSGSGSGSKGIIGLKSAAARTTPGRKSITLEAMFAPFENPAATTRAGSKPVPSGGGADEVRELERTRPEITEVEHAFGKPPEKSRLRALEHFAARTQEAGARHERSTERQQVALMAAGAVQDEQRRRASRGRRLVDVDEVEGHIAGHLLMIARPPTTGSSPQRAS